MKLLNDQSLLFMNCKRSILSVLAMVSLLHAGAQQPELTDPSAGPSIFLRNGGQQSVRWQLKKASETENDGAILSMPGYTGSNWLPAEVPGTVLHNLVANKIYPDPYFGDNNRKSRQLIPDLAEAGKAFYHYWFRTGFSVPATMKGKRIWLKLHGINYRSSIWVNGKNIGTMAGMFNGQAFDITAIAKPGQPNALAVEVIPVDVPGSNSKPKQDRPGAFGENRNGGDGEIGKNVTMLMSVGWDFTAPDGIRDRNTGIWREVELFATGDVTLADPFVQTDLPLPDTSSVRTSISVEVVNHASAARSGSLLMSIPGTGITIKETVALKAGEKKTVTLTPATCPQLNWRNPKLWWPLNKGEQNLYKLELSFQIAGSESHHISRQFGVREMSSDRHTPDSSRRFLVNGHPVFIRGTNWVPEAMLRNTPGRTRAELLYTKQAGINLIRFWGGGIAESDYFFTLCDQLGILIWAEFWITGDTRFPADTKLYFENITNTVKRIRHHASLAYYVSANESTEVKGAGELIRSLDSTRGYQVQSECCGIHDGSPYKYENPMQYFENTASKRGSRVDGFNPEYGTPALPIEASLRQLMPAKDLWPINDSVWNYLDGGGFHGMTTKFKKAVDEFGVSNNISEFAKKAQLVGALNYRAIWEVWNYNKFNYGDRFASGFLFWYHNSPLPQTSSRLYDWWLEPTAALYYSQNGLAPLHPQYDYLKNTVSVYNDYRRAFKGYKVTATIYNLHSKIISRDSAVVDIPADGLVKDALTVSFPSDITPVHFVNLVLKDAKGNIVNDAFYWRSSETYKGAWTLTGPAVSGFQSLKDMPGSKLQATSKTKRKGNNTVIEVTLTNHTNTIAFFTQLQLRNSKGQNIRPAFYSDNFINILPNSARRISIEYDHRGHPGKTRLVVGGWNLPESTINNQ